MGKDADVFVTIAAGDHFWEKSQHEPPILAIILPFAYVENYRGPWISRGLENPEALRAGLEAGFKIAAGRDPKQFLNMGGELCRMWKDPEGRSRTLLLQFLDWARGFPPVRGSLVRGVLPTVSIRPVSETPGSGGGSRRYRKQSAAGRGGPGKVQVQKKQRPLDEGSV